jgi:hypothetical protein
MTMGYSIAAHTKDKASQDRIMDFLKRKLVEPDVTFTQFLNGHWVHPLFMNLQGFPVNTLFDDIPGSLHIRKDSELSYGSGPCRIGYDYGPIPFWERTFRWTFATWIALQIGKRKTFKDPAMKGFGPIPFICYDSEKIPVIPIELLEDPPKQDDERTQFVVDRLGEPVCRKVYSQWESEALIGIGIKDFIAGLDRAWQDENPSSVQRNLKNFTGVNWSNPSITIPRSALEKVGDSDFKRECPFCEGVFFVRRNTATLKLMRNDRCAVCGQSVVWSDADQIWGNEVEP